MIDRERKVDIDKLTPEQADQLSAQIGEKIREIADKAVEDSNRILKIYGMEAKMAIQIGKLGEFEEKKPKKTRKPRKKKEANL